MSLIIELFNALVKLSTLVFIVFFFSNYIERGSGIRKHAEYGK